MGLCRVRQTDRIRGDRARQQPFTITCQFIGSNTMNMEPPPPFRATKGLPTQFLGQALDDRKTQSGVPAAFRADGRLKQLGAHMIGQAWTIVRNGHFHVLTPVQIDPILGGYGIAPPDPNASAALRIRLSSICRMASRPRGNTRGTSTRFNFGPDTVRPA